MTEDEDDEDEEELSDAGWGVLGGLVWAFLFRKKTEKATDNDRWAP